MSSALFFRKRCSVVIPLYLMIIINFILLTVQSESSLKLYELEEHEWTRLTPLNTSPFTFNSVEPIKMEKNPLVTIPLPASNITNGTGVLQIETSRFLLNIATPIIDKKPSLGEAILYSFLGVTFTNLCALIGAICIPIQRHRCYHVMLTFMTSLAVGALMSTALLVLIPEAMRMVEMPAEFGGEGQAYLVKMTAIIFGTLLFYSIEYGLFKLPILLKWNIKSKEVSVSHDHITFSGDNNKEANSLFLPKANAVTGMNSGKITDEDVIIKKKSKCSFSSYFIGIAPVAWMILFGDSFHNLMDGLTIGAGFSKSPTIGLTLSLSILFEELPHELGDFAILLSSGMTVRAALFANFISACSAYVGLVIGLVIGEIPSGAVYVFAVTAGIFLYISLSDMMPKMRGSFEESELKSGGSFKMFLLQIFGFLIGYVCVVTVTVCTSFIQL